MSDSFLHRLVDAGDSGNVDAFDDLLHEDVVVHAPLTLSTTSREAEKAVWLDARAAMPDIRHEIQELFSDGDTRIARVVVTGTLTGAFAGVEADRCAFRMDQVIIAKLRDGKAYELWEIADTGSLIQQLAR